MVQFTNVMENPMYEARLEHIITASEKTIDDGLPARLKTDVQQISFDIRDEYLPVDLVLEPIEDTSAAPLYHQIDETANDSTFTIDVMVDKESPIKFHLFVKSRSTKNPLQSFAVVAPPLHVFEWTTELLDRTFDPDIFDWMTDYYNEDRPVSAVVMYIDEINKYLTSDQFLRIMNSCAEGLSEFREEISNIYTPRSIAGYLPGGEEENILDINSWPRLRQFCATSSQFKYIPTYTESDLVNEAINSLSKPHEDQINTTYDKLWKLEQELDITKQYPELLNEVQSVVLIAKSVQEQQYERIRDLIGCWDQTPKLEDLSDAIQNAKKSDNHQDWKELLSAGVESSLRTFEFVLANFLRTAGENRRVPIQESSFTYHVSSELYGKLGMNDFSLTTRFWEYYLRGRKAQERNQYDLAQNNLRVARKICLQKIYESGSARHVNLAGSWAYFCEARMKYQTDHGDFEIAIEKLENEIRVVDLYQDFPSEEARAYCRIRLQALLHEVKGDKYLSNQKYSEAKSEYGRTIGKLKELSEDREREVIFFKNRISAIEASYLESDGKYREAAVKYDEINERTDLENSFIQFHQSRSLLCQAKEKLVNNEIFEARQYLTNISYKGGILSTEIEHVELLAEFLEDYKKGEKTDIDRILNILMELSAPTSDHVDFDFGYGHDYRIAFIYIFAVQRMKQLIGDEDIFDHLVNISINDVLKPKAIANIINREREKITQQRDIWKGKVPDFIVRQLQNIERETASKRPSSNYLSQLKNLTGQVEEALEILIAYHARQKYGDNWVERITPDGKINLRNLRDYLNKDQFKSEPWLTELRELIDSIEFADIVMSDKAGTIIDLRNDLAHNNVSSISQEEFHSAKKHIESILATLSRGIPVLGVVGEQNQYQAYSVRLLKLGPDDEIDVLTDKELQMNHIYFFPHEAMTGEIVSNFDSEQIQPCKEEDILESIRSHSNVSGL